MNVLPFLNWLLRTSWQASVLVLLVLAAQWLFRRRLNAHWQFTLWFLVVIRLAMPSPPTSSWSLFNVVQYSAAKPAPFRIDSDVAPPTVSVPVANSVTEATPIIENVDRGHAEPPPAIAVFDKQRVLRNAAVVWLAGLLLLGGRAIGQNIVFTRRLRHAKAVTDEETLALFRQCKEVMNVSSAVPLAETSHVKSPALYGLFRPTLLLPVNVMAQFSATEKRHVFLHELAHVKRRDMAVHWVATGFRLLHWFNPVLWFGFQRMAADRELACDELALSRAGKDEARPYGETVLKLLELCARPAVLPGLMGILEERSQMTRRILRIARYERQSGWPIVALLLLVGLGLVTLTDAQLEKPKPDLTGQVRMTNGAPIMATVFIASAGPKIGTSTFCPSCYADCTKCAKADGQGHFKIESLDPTLQFRILVVAKDCAPKYVTKVDPAKGPVTVELEPRNYADSPPANTLHGRVVDAKGAPIVGAAVEAHGIRHKDGSGLCGALDSVDPLAVTDDKGEFLITSLKPFAAMDVKVEARGFATKAFTELRSGTTRHDLMMTGGAVVSGRVAWNGKPLAGVSVGIVSSDRGPEHTFVNFEIGTSADGRFAFINLPPNDQFNVYGIMQSLRTYGAVMPIQISTGADGSSVDAGDLVIGPARRLAGRVMLDDGKPIPAKTRLLIGREDAWDTLQIELDADGQFDTTGIPSGLVDVSVRVPGYHISRKNHGLDVLNPFRLFGRVDQDTTNLAILLERGPDLEANYNPPPGDWPPKQALRGIEGGPRPEQSPSQNWTVSGHVTDAKTGQPVPVFMVTPGFKQFERFIFDGYGEFRGTNGVYAVNLSKRLSDPYLKIEADGYLPIATSLPLGNRTDFDIKLKQGTGPSGIVLLPDGKPAANVTVALICAGKQGTRIGNDGALLGPGLNKLEGATGNDGSFSFMPTVDMINVAASSEAGFKLVSVGELASNPKIVLEQWGRVTGVLRSPSGPGTNEELSLSWARETMAFSPSLQTGCSADTDDQGRFDFDRVPPGKLTVFRSVKINEHASNLVPLHDIIVSPGKTLEVKIDETEREASIYVPHPKPPRKFGPAINGTVVQPDGKPASGVQVALILPDSYLGLRKGSLQTRKEPGVQTVADDAGHFTLPGVEGATGIVAAAETGFARVNLPGSNSPTLTLQPWGEIHGTLRVGRRLGANQSVVLAQDSSYGLTGFTYDSTDYKAQADDQGRFIITYAPPGGQRLARVINGGWSPWSGTFVNVKAGGVTDVTVGGTGREVVGKAIYNDAPADFDWKEVRFSLSTVRPSETGTNYLNWKPRPYRAEPVTNGSLVFEDVLPGTYGLSASVWRTPGKPFKHIGNMLRMDMRAAGAKEITIPEPLSGQGAEPFDAGTLNIRANQPLNVGDPATEIEAETSGGRKLHLADFRGKFVLLNILMTDSSGIAIPQLKEAFEAFGRDDRLSMLSVSLLPVQSLGEFARTNGISWTLASLSKPSVEFEDYYQAVSDFSDSQLYLIDPQGKILAKNLHGKAINEAVAKALAGK